MKSTCKKLNTNKFFSPRFRLTKIPFFFLIDFLSCLCRNERFKYYRFDKNSSV